MMLAARGIFLAARRSRKPTAKSYVQDGLIAMWDGIENAGWGVHDASATTWKDLVGQNDMTFAEPSAITVLGDAMQFTKESVSTGGRSMMASAPSNVVMVDICISCVSGFSSNQNIFLGPTSANGQNLLSVIAANRNRGFVCTVGPMLGPGESDIGSCTIATTGSAGWKNGVALTPSSDNGSGYINDGYVALCAGALQNFKVHSLRLYSRALTAAEIAANYAVDKVRFNLPDAT